MIVQGVPNRSMHMPNMGEKKVSAIGWVTVPPSASASNTRLAPHSVARGAYYFGIQHFEGYALDCVGGRERGRRSFEGSAPTGHVFRRES